MIDLQLMFIKALAGLHSARYDKGLETQHGLRDFMYFYYILLGGFAILLNSYDKNKHLYDIIHMILKYFDKIAFDKIEYMLRAMTHIVTQLYW